MSFNSTDFKNKYNGKRDLIIAVVIDALSQEAENEGKSVMLEKYNFFNELEFLVFPNGLDLFNTQEQCIVSIVYSESELHVKKLFLVIKNRTKISNVIFVCLDEIEENTNPKKDYKVFGFSVISQLMENYKSVYLSNLIDNTDHTDSNSPVGQNNTSDIKTEDKESEASKKSRLHKDEFSSYLQNSSGKCAFILGNGVSIPFGADSWDLLITNLTDYLTPFYLERQDKIVKALSDSNYIVSDFVKQFLESKSHPDIFESGLRYCIYRKYHPEMLEENSIIKAIALTKLKYNSLEIYTYNYDTFLEYQIRKEDPLFRVRPVCSKNYKKHIVKGIIHLHGYLLEKPSNSKKGINIVLTDEDYFEKYFSKNNWVYKAQVNALVNNHCMYIGSSMSDLFQLSTINDAFRRSSKDSEWFCYALLCFKGLDDAEKERLIDFYYGKHIKVIFVDEYSKLKDVIYDLSNITYTKQKEIAD